MGDCAGCGNEITGTKLSDGKSAGQGCVHYVCKAEYDRRDREPICRMCGVVSVEASGDTCNECQNGPDKYQLEDFYASLP